MMLEVVILLSATPHSEKRRELQFLGNHLWVFFVCVCVAGILSVDRHIPEIAIVGLSDFSRLNSLRSSNLKHSL